jgi:hypothetical protein
MEALQLIVFIASVVIGAIAMLAYLNQCPHDWKKIEEYEIRKSSDNSLTGYSAIHECVHCKKLKATRINLK